MQYVSAVALAGLSGKAPSTSQFTQPRSQSSPSSMPLASPSIWLRSLPSLTPSRAELSTMYLPLHSGHQQRFVESLCWIFSCSRQEGGEEG